MPQVTMPQLGEGVEEGTIGKWLKSVGDHVRIGDPLVEVVTDKVNAEVPSPFEGTLTRILVAEGDTIANDVPIAEVEAGDVAASLESPTEQMTLEPEAAALAEPPQPVPTPAAPAPASAAPAPTPPAPAAPAAPIVVPTNIRMTPAVRRLARDLRVDVSAIAGSGIGGRITRDDVERAASAPSVPAPAPAPAAAVPAASPTPTTPAADLDDSPVKGGDSLKKLSPMRKAIVKHMERFLDVPAAYITVEVDMTPVVGARTAINADYKSREGMSMSYVAYMTKACVEALRKHPDINAHWTDEGHWRRKAINIGIAVAVADGLVVPVIKNAENLSLHGLNAAINDLAKRARNKKLRPEDLEGGTFTVDNTGWTGSILTLPIINVPEVAIVTMEKIVKRPVVLEGQGDAIAVRSMMNMCIAIDHRATDGAQAGAFLQDVGAWLGSVDADTPIW
ncbi:MAG: dihydrolipoamide acetyltransferase family protein [Chloroflexota bacterium]|nr:dihydrolipoamide acetyltransferase family protein [Chloroflexota bacterium]